MPIAALCKPLDTSRWLPPWCAMLRNNSVMKKLVETGEERIGRVAQQLLSNERFVAAVQTLVSRTLAAKGSLDKSLRGALAAMNLPSTADVEVLRTKVDDLEKLLASIEAKVDSLASTREKKSGQA
jgi:hypothetical protein